MRRPPRLLVAALAGVVTGLVTWGTGRVLADAFACRPPTAWWPGWAWPCLDETGQLVRDLTGMGWDTALPLLLGVAVFLAVGLSRTR
ncbi:hypothetical protein [Jannaschia seohaensis]|uniref:Uncharacterized protein n=1 Tax=Jannaschia seohaensis TaxID=475081 RepID=A0A2Y9B505_9RHOB|nr:hypothetical protein [Jannaschia seohaensis]PWJ13262.1 hypothetical protein BCF38_11424 [Jannaschia seohaensis]SSA50588.1 hypothetical protein SAMN05421539_11424 [Jannaschia seohaensis]